MYKLAVQNWIQGKIGPKDIDLLVRVRRLTPAQGAAIKAMERITPYIEPETTVNNESADN